MIIIEYLEEEIPVYDITVKDNENFYANDILVHNCLEILLATTPMKHIHDEEAEIALCLLGNINAGKLKSFDSMERLAYNMIKGIDNIIDSQDYPLPAAKNSTLNARYLGIGVSDWSHYLTKQKVRYDSQEALDLSEEFMERWQFNLLTASCRLARERGEVAWFREKSKYADGWLPNDGKWKFIPHEDWEKLRQDILKYGLRNLTLSAIPPAACQSKQSKIQTPNGNMSLDEIMKLQDISSNALELDGIQRWVEFKKPVDVITRDGIREVNRIWYNGKQPTRKLTFEDGNTYEFTLNHKLLCVKDGVEQWIEAQHIDSDTEVVSV